MHIAPIIENYCCFFLWLNKPIGKVIDNYVGGVLLKDSCDGSGLNTSENSKDSHSLNSGRFF